MICNKLTFNLISEGSKVSEPAGAKISICWRLQDEMEDLSCSDALAWQGKDGINPGHEGNHLWNHPSCAHSLSLKPFQPFNSRRGRFPHWELARRGSPGDLSQRFTHSLFLRVPWDVTRLGTSTHTRTEFSPAAESHKNPIFPPGSPLCTCRTGGGRTVSAQRRQK